MRPASAIASTSPWAIWLIRASASSLAGAETLFLVNSGPEIGSRDAAAAQGPRGGHQAAGEAVVARRAGEQGRPTAVALWHARGEAAIRASGVPFTFVQSVGFMTNALAWARTIKAEGIVRASTGEGRSP